MKTRFISRYFIPMIATTMTTVAFGAMDREARLTELECQMKQVHTKTAMDTYGANTAEARPNVDGCQWFAMVDVLYWRSKVGGTEFAYSDQDSTATLPIKGRTKQMEFKWDWGVRAGLGYNFMHDGWDLRGDYTWFNNSGSESTSAGLNSSVVPLRGSSTIAGVVNNTQNLFLYCTSAKSMFDLEYQAIDLELGRDFYVSSKVSLRPFWGLKTTWFDLKQITRYTGGNPSGDNNVILGLAQDTVHVRDQSDFWGLGPRTGVDTRWYLGEGFSLFGNLSGALLYGYFDVAHKEKLTSSTARRINLSANRHAFSPTVQYQMGLSWDSYFRHNKNHFTIGLGFEGQYWWRMNQMLKVDDATVLKYERYSEDVSTYGLTLNMKLEF